MLAFRDDLSCGPIDSDDPSLRAAWWDRFYDNSGTLIALTSFWERATSTEERLVVWFGRHSASELAFFLAWADRLGERPYNIVDVTGRRLRWKRSDGTVALSEPYQAVSIIPSEALKLLLGTDEPISLEVREKCRLDWQRLRADNAPFRVVTGDGLTSAQADFFDPLLLAEAKGEWQMIRRVVGNAMVLNSQPYFQVGDVMLHTRVIALVESGSLVTDGDPWNMSSRVRLSDGS